MPSLSVQVIGNDSISNVLQVYASDAHTTCYSRYTRIY